MSQQKIVCMWCWKEPERVYFIKGYSYCKECAQIEFNMSLHRGDIKVDELDVEMDKIRKREYL